MDSPVKGQVYAAVIGDRTRLVTAELVMDGGMVEFHDAATGLHAGCAGIHWWQEPGHVLEIPSEYVPKVPEPGRWIGGIGGR